MILAYIFGVMLGGGFMLWLIWELIKIFVKAVYYLTHMKKIKAEKKLEKKERELHQWQREQWVKETEEKRRRVQEKQAKQKEQRPLQGKEKDRRDAIKYGAEDWFERKYGETVDGEKI